MDKTILVRVESVWGTLRIVPANAQAQNLAAIANTKTLTPTTLKVARLMGFEVIEQGTARLPQAMGETS